MSFYASYPPAGSNASVSINGNPIPTSSTLIAGENPSGNLQPVSVDANGDVNVNIVSALVPTSYNEIDLTYIPSGNGAGQIGTATYKLSGVTVATLTLTYDSSNNLITVVKA